MNLHHDVRMHLLNLLDRPADETRLNQALRLLSKWRSVLIRNRLLLQQGTVVMEGILEGLDFLTDSAEGCHIAKLLGCYEQPLQPYLEAAIHTGYDTVINIGCAEGYYAVGMARKMQGTRILAYDLNPKARKVCAELAKKTASPTGSRSARCSGPKILLPVPTVTYWFSAISKALKKICSILPLLLHCREWILLSNPTNVS